MYFLNLNVTVFSVGVVYNIPHRVFCFRMDRGS